MYFKNEIKYSKRPGHSTYDVITLDLTWEDFLCQMLSCYGVTFFYVYNCQSFETKKLPISKDSGIIFMIIIYLIIFIVNIIVVIIISFM